MSDSNATGASDAKGLPTIDVNEYGGKKEGLKTVLNRRLFMQLLVFRTERTKEASTMQEVDLGMRSGPDAPPDAIAAELVTILQQRKIPGVVYADTMDPRSLGLLTWTEDPANFVSTVRPLFNESPLKRVELRDEMSMIGRTYGLGHEPDLEYSLLGRPIDNVMRENTRWHIWYPLRRKGVFTKLEQNDQTNVMREHAALGLAYGQKELATDVRLACHGLDSKDNDYVIGLMGQDLHPLSHLVESMRKTRQTSEFIEKMGPFFLGYVLGSSSGE